MINTIQDNHAPLLTVTSLLVCISVLLWAHDHPDGLGLFIGSVVLFSLEVLHWLWTVYQQKQANRLSSKRLTFGIMSFLWVVLVLMFAYAQVPLFHTACSAFGFNGKMVKHDHAHWSVGAIDASRTVKLQAFAHVNLLAPVTVSNKNQQLLVNPGQAFDLSYPVKNTTDQALVLRSVLSLVPSDVGHYLHRTDHAAELFELEPGEEKLFEASFILSDQIPKSIGTLALQFTLFNTEGVGHFGSSDAWYEIRSKKNHGVGLD
ncbi:MAG: hypothetical protein CMF46_02615 [Legionellales bacterium]|nr:hypothetical protein [Legionellales bacterium]|tara:strand:- start:1404 stop:2186 length:783 start_codon:yes stop_codon:yes gene_type:complete